MGGPALGTARPSELSLPGGGARASGVPPLPSPPRALGGRAGLCVRDLMAGSHGHPARAAGRAAGERLRCSLWTGTQTEGPEG